MDSWRPPSEVVESTSGPVEFTSELVESADLPVLAVPVPARPPLDLKCVTRAPDRLDSACTPNSSRCDPGGLPRRAAPSRLLHARISPHFSQYCFDVVATGGFNLDRTLAHPRRPPHQVVNAVRVDLLESKALVEAKGGIECLDVDGDRLAGSIAAVDHLVKKHRSDP